MSPIVCLSSLARKSCIETLYSNDQCAYHQFRMMNPMNVAIQVLFTWSLNENTAAALEMGICSVDDEDEASSVIPIPDTLGSTNNGYVLLDTFGNREKQILRLSSSESFTLQANETRTFYLSCRPKRRLEALLDVETWTVQCLLTVSFVTVPEEYSIMPCPPGYEATESLKDQPLHSNYPIKFKIRTCRSLLTTDLKQKLVFEETPLGETLVRDLTLWNRSEIPLNWRYSLVQENTGNVNLLEEELRCLDYETGELLEREMMLQGHAYKRVRVQWRPSQVGVFQFTLQWLNLCDEENKVLVSVEAKAVKPVLVSAVTAPMSEGPLQVIAASVPPLDFGETCAGIWRAYRIRCRHLGQEPWGPLEVTLSSEGGEVRFMPRSSTATVQKNRQRQWSMENKEVTDFIAGHVTPPSRPSSPVVRAAASVTAHPQESVELEVVSPVDGDAVVNALTHSQTGPTEQPVDTISLAPHQERVLDVRYRAPKEDDTSGQFTSRRFKLLFHFTDGLLKDSLTIPCRAKSCLSLIEVSQKWIQFGECDIGVNRSMTFTVTNKSAITARVQLRVQSKVLSLDTVSMTLLPFQSLPVRVDLCPRKLNPDYRKTIQIVNILHRDNDTTLEVRAVCVDQKRVALHELFYQVREQQQIVPQALDCGATNATVMRGWQVRNRTMEPLVLEWMSSKDIKLWVLNDIGNAAPTATTGTVQFSVGSSTASLLSNVPSTTPLSITATATTATSSTPTNTTISTRHSVSRREQWLASMGDRQAARLTARRSLIRKDTSAEAMSLFTLSQRELSRPASNASGSSDYLDLAVSQDGSKSSPRRRMTSSHATSTNHAVTTTSIARTGRPSSVGGASHVNSITNEDRLHQLLKALLQDSLTPVLELLLNPVPKKWPMDWLCFALVHLPQLDPSLLTKPIHEERLTRTLVQLLREWDEAIKDGWIVPCDRMILMPNEDKNIMVVYSPQLHQNNSNAGSGTPTTGAQKKSSQSLQGMKQENGRIQVKLVEYDWRILAQHKDVYAPLIQANANASGVSLPGQHSFGILSSLTHSSSSHTSTSLLQLPLREWMIRAQPQRQQMDIAQKVFNFGLLERGTKCIKTLVIRNRSTLPIFYAIRPSGNIASGDVSMAQRYGIVRGLQKKEIEFVFLPTLAGLFNEKVTIDNVLDRENVQHLLIKAHIRKPSTFFIQSLELVFTGCLLGQVSSAVPLILTSTTTKQRTIEIVITKDPAREWFLTLESTSTKRMTREQEEQLESLEQKLKIAQRKGREDKVKKIMETLQSLKPVDASLGGNALMTVTAPRKMEGSFIVTLDPESTVTVHVQVRPLEIVDSGLNETGAVMEGAFTVQEWKNADTAKQVTYKVYLSSQLPPVGASGSTSALLNSTSHLSLDSNGTESSTVPVSAITPQASYVPLPSPQWSRDTLYLEEEWMLHRVSSTNSSLSTFENNETSALVQLDVTSYDLGRVECGKKTLFYVCLKCLAPATLSTATSTTAALENSVSVMVRVQCPEEIQLVTGAETLLLTELSTRIYFHLTANQHGKQDRSILFYTNTLVPLSFQLSYLATFSKYLSFPASIEETLSLGECFLSSQGLFTCPLQVESCTTEEIQVTCHSTLSSQVQVQCHAFTHFQTMGQQGTWTLILQPTLTQQQLQQGECRLLVGGLKCLIQQNNITLFTQVLKFQALVGAPCLVMQPTDPIFWECSFNDEKRLFREERVLYNKSKLMPVKVSFEGSHSELRVAPPFAVIPPQSQVPISLEYERSEPGYESMIVKVLMQETENEVFSVPIHVLVDPGWLVLDQRECYWSNLILSEHWAVVNSTPIRLTILNEFQDLKWSFSDESLGIGVEVTLIETCLCIQPYSFALSKEEKSNLLSGKKVTIFCFLKVMNASVVDCPVIGWIPLTFDLYRPLITFLSEQVWEWGRLGAVDGYAKRELKLDWMNANESLEGWIEWVDDVTPPGCKIISSQRLVAQQTTSLLIEVNPLEWRDLDWVKGQSLQLCLREKQSHQKWNVQIHFEWTSLLIQAQWKEASISQFTFENPIHVRTLLLTNQSSETSVSCQIHWKLDSSLEKYFSVECDSSIFHLAPLEEKFLPVKSSWIASPFLSFTGSLMELEIVQMDFNLKQQLVWPAQINGQSYLECPKHVTLSKQNDNLFHGWFYLQNKSLYWECSFTLESINGIQFSSSVLKETHGVIAAGEQIRLEVQSESDLISMTKIYHENQEFCIPLIYSFDKDLTFDASPQIRDGVIQKEGEQGLLVRGCQVLDQDRYDLDVGQQDWNSQEPIERKLLLENRSLQSITFTLYPLHDSDTSWMQLSRTKGVIPSLSTETIPLTFMTQVCGLFSSYLMIETSQQDKRWIRVQMEVTRASAECVFDVQCHGYLPTSVLDLGPCYFGCESRTRTLLLHNRQSVPLDFSFTWNMDAEEKSEILVSQSRTCPKLFKVLTVEPESRVRVYVTLLPRPKQNQVAALDYVEEKRFTVSVNCRLVRHYQKTLTVVAMCRFPQICLSSIEQHCFFQGIIQESPVPSLVVEPEFIDVNVGNCFDTPLDLTLFSDTTGFLVESLTLPHLSSRSQTWTLRVRPHLAFLSTKLSSLSRDKYLHESCAIYNTQQVNEFRVLTLRLSLGHWQHFHLTPAKSAFVYSCLEARIVSLLNSRVVHEEDDSLFLEFKYIVDQLMVLATRGAGESYLQLAYLLFSQLLRNKVKSSWLDYMKVFVLCFPQKHVVLEALVELLGLLENKIQVS